MRIKQLIIPAVAAALLSLPVSCSQQASSPDISSIESSFMNPPDSVRIACYWYWLNDNLSPEGVVEDLHAMKAAGITRAQIGMIATAGLPYGDAKFMGKKWWATLHQALKTAGELDIEIGIFNSPGWSQSGGPWVKPEQSMRCIVSSQTSVAGGGERTITIPALDEACQDVAIIAYPDFASEAFSQNFTVAKKEGRVVSREISLSKEATLRSAEILVSTPMRTIGTLKVKNGEDWRVLRQFDIDRYNAQNIVGFEPYAPIYISLPETKAKELLFEMNAPGAGEVTLTLSERPKVERAAEKQLAKMCQEPLPMWDFYMWNAEPEYTSDNWTIDPSKVVLLTDKAKDGKIRWDVPPGKWIVSRIGMATTGVTNSPATPEATGLEIDKINKAHLQGHFDAYIGEIMRRIPAEDRKTFKILVEDSYETGGQNWTDGLADKFRERYGYDPLPYLPVLRGIPVGSNDLSNRFLWDLRRLVADLIATEYVGGLKEISNKNGLTTWLENYGHWGFPSEFLLYGGQSDEIAGEYWSEGTLGDIENRAASSCAHIYGKQRVWSESCTAAGKPFSRYPYLMKQRVDRFFAEGINASLLHLFIHQTAGHERPGIAAWFGNEFNRKNTWFGQLKSFTDYLRRCNFVLQQGRYVADVAYFIGEDAPKMTGECSPELPPGYSFDYINADILRNHAHVKNGRLILDSGMEYRVLVLPRQTTMRPEMLETIEKFVSEGLTVLGPKPESSPSLQHYPEADKRVAKLASTMWPDNENVKNHGKGKVWTDGNELSEIFADMNIIPDLSVGIGETHPLFIHRTLKDSEIYFVANPTEEKVKFTANFRVNPILKPQLWNATNGEIRALPEFTSHSDHVSVPLQLEALESAFIVFRKVVTTRTDSKNYPTTSELADLSANGWTIRFTDRSQGPKYEVKVKKLFDWTSSSNKNIANYSGSAVYRTTFKLSSRPSGRTWLDLGQVMVMAKVKVNGQNAGGVWTPPYRVEITPFLTKDKNIIEVEVVNNWRNRMIADAALPPAERISSCNLTLFTPNDTPQASGLLGPVKILKE